MKLIVFISPSFSNLSKLKIMVGIILKFELHFNLGKAIHTSSNGSEECLYKNGLRQGPSIDKRENGDVEERSYTNGVLEGKAVLLGGNGDRLEFTYR